MTKLIDRARATAKRIRHAYRHRNARHYTKPMTPEAFNADRAMWLAKMGAVRRYLVAMPRYADPFRPGQPCGNLVRPYVAAGTW